MAWSAPPGFEGSYEVSDDGQVRGLDRLSLSRWGTKNNPTKGVIKSQRINRWGYATVMLGVGVRQKKHLLVHRLVLSAFAPVEGWQELQVNHKDGNKQNNSLSNLEWVTCRENVLHSYRVLGKKLGQAHGRAKLTNDQALEIRGIAGRSQQSIADEYGVSQQVISSILRRKTWTHI
jgi:hypothetical protein